MTIDQVVMDGLRHMGTLTKLKNVGYPLHERLKRLYELSCERIEKGGRDLALVPKIKEILPDIPEAPKWVTYTDKMHTVASFSYLADICNKEDFSVREQKIVLSAMIVHDCAYPDIKDFRKARKKHMKDGEKAFREFVCKIDDEFLDRYCWKGRDVIASISGDLDRGSECSIIYDFDDVEDIAAIIRQHDNPSTKDSKGRPLQFSYYPPSEKKLLWAHREADRLWMLDRAGFALDLFRRLVEDEPWYNPEKYLKHVISKHVEEAAIYKDNEKCIPLKEGWLKGEKTLYRTKAGFDLFSDLVKEREEEYGVDLNG